MTDFQTPFGRTRPKAPGRADRNVRCRKRRPCEGYCGLTIEVGDEMWILTATDSRVCCDCYDVRQAERR